MFFSHATLVFAALFMVSAAVFGILAMAVHPSRSHIPYTAMYAAAGMATFVLAVGIRA